ncbi:MAG: DUF4349 domain-containing protein [Chloroflexota bacterium]
MQTRLRSRRAYMLAAGVSAVALTTFTFVACSSAAAPTSGSGSSGTIQTSATVASAKPAGSAVDSSKASESAKPANVAQAPAVAPTSMPRPAATAVAPVAAAKPAEADARAPSSAGAAAPAPPAALARPASQPAPSAQAPAPQSIVPPAPGPTPARPADPAPVAPAQAGRMVIYTTEISLLVTSPAQLVNSLGDVATQAGGYVAGVENKDDGGIALTTIRLKVPPDRYEAAMKQIRALAVEVTGEKATTQDVTEEFSDVQTQLASLEATHAQLLELLKKATTVEEILKIQEKVSQTKVQIDRLKGRETFLQRSSDLATVTVNARPAEDVLARTYSTLRTSLRRSEAQRNQTIKAIQAAKTPEEEATLRDRLGEINLEMDRLNARIADLQNKAKTANITLPSAPADDPVAATTNDQDLLKEYMQLRGDRRLADLEVDRLTREQRGTPESREALIQAKLRVSALDTQTKNLEERARRAGVTLPSLSAAEIDALAGLPPESFWSRLNVGWAIVAGLAVLAVGGVGIRLGRRTRRPPAGPAPAAA